MNCIRKILMRRRMQRAHDKLLHANTAVIRLWLERKAVTPEALDTLVEAARGYFSARGDDLKSGRDQSTRSGL